MARDFVFITTTGQTDVQVVLPRPDGRTSYPVSKDAQRHFQEACVAGKLRWRMLPFEETTGLPERRHVPLKLASASRLSSDLSVNNPDDLAEWDCGQGVELCAPLLARCCRQLRGMKLGQPRRAIVLTTRRDSPDDSEPVGVFALVRDALAEGLGLPVEAIEELVFLTERDLYEADARGQRHLRTSAARRIDVRLKALAREHPGAVAVVSEVAGIPEIKPVLAASAQYRFADVRFLRPTEEGRDTEARPGVLVPPADSLAARAAVARLVRQGGFNDAAAIARHPAGDKVSETEPWRRWLEHVADVLEGAAPPDMARRLEGTPGSATCRALLAILRAGPTTAVAFRAEVALRREAWSAALRETFTFAEMALIELINRHLAHPGRLCLDWTRNEFYPGEATELSLQVGDFLKQGGWLGRRTVRLYETGDTLLDLLRQQLPRPAQAALDGFEQRLRDVRTYRNVATHACLDESCIRDCRERLRESNVWPAKQPPGFLGGAAAPVLAALGVPDAAALYQVLVDSILADLDAFSFREP